MFWFTAMRRYPMPTCGRQEMKAKGYATQDIAEITGLTAEEIKAI